MEKRPCSLCHTGFRTGDVICDSPIYKDAESVFHEPCLRRIEEIMEEEGTNDIQHIIY